VNFVASQMLAFGYLNYEAASYIDCIWFENFDFWLSCLSGWGVSGLNVVLDFRFSA
jgi:hypothetical protein